MSEDEINENMELWDSVSETNPDYTKKSDYGAELTSISPAYMFKKATEQWGPFGLNWGATVTEDTYEKGNMQYAWVDGKPIELEHNQHHTCVIEFFYPDEDGEKVSFLSYGHTPYIFYDNFNNVMKTNIEARKSSFTDALKKALSMLGFCADIYLGEFDNEFYIEAMKTKKKIEGAIDKVQATSEALEEFDNWFEKEIAIYEKIPNQKSLKLVCVRHKQEIELRCKAISIDSKGYLKKQQEKMEEALDEIKQHEEEKS